MKVSKTALLSALPLASAAACISSGDQTAINKAFSSGGANTVVQLCPSALIQITGTILFTAAGQEISTQGYPTGSTRATIQIKPGSSATQIIAGNGLSNIRIRNVQLDGNRPNAGLNPTVWGANIEIGGPGTGMVIDHVRSLNPRGWSCMHVIGSGMDNNPCTNATVTNNDVGPCGEGGSDANGNSQWADGISFDCTNSVVQNNTVTGSTDGGIVIFGSPGTLVSGNTITSSAQYQGFAAIGMVDYGYHGSFAGVTVSDNVIHGQKLFSLGIAMGANTWSFNDPAPLRGPTKVINNVFSGNIGFPIALNGWTDGLTITGNEACAVNYVKSSFADASHCDAGIKELFNKGARFAYYPAGVTGTHTLQENFIPATSNVTDFSCISLPLPSSVTIPAGGLNIVPDGAPFGDVVGAIAQFQGDNNVVVYAGGSPVWASMHTLDQGCGNPPQCKMMFSANGELLTQYQGKTMWTTGTAGKGKSMVVLGKAPWIQILDATGKVVWDTTKS